MIRELLKRTLAYMDQYEWANRKDSVQLYEEIETYLAQPEPEPVAQVGGAKSVHWFNKNIPKGTYLYVAPIYTSEKCVDETGKDRHIEPVAWKNPKSEPSEAWFSNYEFEGWTPLYTSPPDQSARIAELEALNADLLRQLSSYQVDWESQEDLLEQLYCEFDADKKKHPEDERIRFKGKLRFFAGQVNQYANTLTDTYKRKSESAEQQLAALQAKREPLSDEQIAVIWEETPGFEDELIDNFARAIEAAHGIGGE